MNLLNYQEDQMDLELAKKILKDGLSNLPIHNDLLFVFGCPGKKHRKARVEKAVSLYQKGYSPKILFSGGNVKNVEEALDMKQEAMSLGVKEEDILVETESLNTAENVIASLFVIEKNLHLSCIKTILFISDEAHLKRCLLTAKKYLPSYIHFEGITTDFLIEQEREEDIIKEAQKLIHYAKVGFIEPQL